MAPNTLDELLKLPPDERAELALALWENLSDADREAEFVLSDQQRDELDRRLAEHLADPESAVAWDDVERSSRATPNCRR